MNGFSITNNAVLATGNTTITGFANVTSTLAAGNTTITGFVSANNLYANGATGQSFKATVLGAAQGEKSALTMYSTFTGTADNGPRRTVDIVSGFVGGAWGNETLTFHIGYGGGSNDSGNTNIQRLLINATSFAVNSLAFSGITTLAAGNTTVTGFTTVSSARGAVAVPTAGQNNSALYVTGSDTAYGVLFGTDPSTGRGWIQAQRTDGTATTYALRLNPAGGITEFGAGYSETEVAASVTGTWTMDCAAANFFDLTLTGSITISPSNVPANGRVWSGTIVAKQDATGGRTITWPSGIKWPGGSAPPATTTANATDIWSLMTYDGGSTWVASLSVKNVA
jgi:hypothetical protein